MEGELQDWELLQHNTDDDDDDYDVVVAAPAAAAAAAADDDDDDDEFSREEEFDESESGIRSDYFALDSNYNNNRGYDNTTRITTPQEEEFVDDDQGSVQSDNPSWLDPSSQGITFETRGAGEFWSDSASDGSSVSRKFEGFECKHDELGFVDDVKSEVGVQGNDEKIVGSAEFWSDSGGETETPAKSESGDSGNENNLGVSTEADENQGRRDELGSAEGIGSLSPQVVNSGGGGGGGDQRGVNVWWKLPLELLKFCVFRVSPVWSVSIAAAVVGFVILKRRLFRMKHKTQRIALNVTLEDMKVSQFMARAARLNEAFSVVKRVPMIRPSLPAAGLTPWPVMSLR
ncbi:hypothetical protein MKX01_037691 [Papaver californicum]|nr:hypothetical protein MKX01_037691 [Papaver californicum]